ncbi:MAG TPA: Fe-S cluster assembly ATPase SufC [Candidatus Norongarragalinales archaeon]|jgi:Fe-S cluster assembly ATP-binding protein|nr:Fe-S cluster assembly ATPase SufC [Candidatus Norongarragalinales archaeon]
MAKLEIKDLHASVEGKEILKGVNLTLKQGEIHAVMGPNGSGKSTLASVIMGHPKYKVTKGEILLDGKNVVEMSVDERAKLGLFLAPQYPQELPGVNFEHLLHLSYRTLNQAQGKPVLKPLEFRKLVAEKREILGLDDSFLRRSVNEGFSGGEKKRAEVLQLLLADPKIAILDETDSGLDVDSLKLVAKAVGTLRGPNFGALVITHYQRILEYLKPDYVHVLMDGKVVKSGGADLVHEVEKKGYAWLAQPAGA